MRTLKIMSIIGIVLSAISSICIFAFSNESDWEAAVGWGIYASMYLIAFSIVGVVQASKNKIIK